MLSLAFAQMVWATASQWVSFTGGDNGLIGLQFFDGMSRWIFQVVLILLCFVTLFGFSRLIRSSFGAALQAGRDAPQRAQASALNVANLNQRVFLIERWLGGFVGRFVGHEQRRCLPFCGVCFQFSRCPDGRFIGWGASALGCICRQSIFGGSGLRNRAIL